MHVGMSEDAGDVLIRVVDTGVGISPDVLPHIFDRFRQADSSTTRKFGGLGLGLSIVKHIVEAHGGAITASSGGPGLGSCFEVRLPLIESVSNERAVLGGPEPAPSLLTGTRVLVVEDEADSRELLVQVLQKHGASVKSAACATDALDLLSAFEPHVLVSDIGMPGMDGYALLRTIRQVATTTIRNVPAIAMTAFVRPEDQALQGRWLRPARRQANKSP